MKETGIIRKIDELGRIVLPKEIRKTLGIKDGEDLEIFVKDQGVFLQKYSRLQNLSQMIQVLINLAVEELNVNLIAIDCEQVVCSFDKTMEGKKIDDSLYKYVVNRERFLSNEPHTYWNIEGYFYMIPLIISGDVIGAIVIYNEQPLKNYMISFTNFLAKIIINKIDIL